MLLAVYGLHSCTQVNGGGHFDGQIYVGTGKPLSHLEWFVQVDAENENKKPVGAGLCTFMQVSVPY